ncbi:MAG: 3-hydroxyacyl-CoA dehydrogenase [Myxococcales bacterium]|nr:3-hydroxyacyl-CoA dehydrogenase [Myxococcales bacterium]
MSATRIDRVAVVGAGVMGTGIATHLASCGFDVLLVDIVGRDAPAPVVADHPDAGRVRAARNALTRGGLERALKLKPAPLQHAADVGRITVGNLEDDVAALGRCDWIVEAVLERLDVKQAVFGKIDAVRAPHAIVSSNTSGIPLQTMVEGRSAGFARHFVITHFFNPVRYMKLVELVSGAATDPAVTARMESFLQDRLGKGVVRAMDTVNFIANRIGVHDMLQAVQFAVAGGLRVEEVDAICGEPLGRPKSAVFRTADVVGLDTLGHVAQNCYDNLGHDPRRGVFALPAVLRQLIAAGTTGQKVGAGFYKKVGPDILALDLATGQYAAQQKIEHPSLAAAKKTRDLGARVRALVAADDGAGRYAWAVLSASLTYAADLLGEIADDVVSIDRAMRWGFNWQLGPFELWDALGVQAVTDRLRAEGRLVPAAVAGLLARGEATFYAGVPAARSQLQVGGAHVAVPALPGLHLADLRAQGKVVDQNASAELIDLGERVLCLAFRSKMNALDAGIIEMGWKALARVDAEGWTGLVIANDGANFSVGANLGFIAQLAAAEQWAGLDAAVQQFQKLFMAFKYSAAPVVSAPHQLTLGGGCEIAMHATRMQAAAETYMGLVEVGVGLLPGAGGTKELAVRALDGVGVDSRVDRVALLQKAFETIALAKTSTGAGQLRDLGFQRAIDAVSVDGDQRIEDARRVVLQLAANGHRPPLPPANLLLPGQEGVATFDLALYAFKVAGQATAHDCEVGHRIARVLCGGTRGGLCTEQDLLDLEREGFLALCGMAATQARVKHMLETGKPLRN